MIQSVHSVQLPVLIRCLCHSICILEYFVSDIQLKLLFLIYDVLYPCKDETSTYFVGFIGIGFPAVNKRHFMSGVYIPEFTGHKIQHTLKGCNEHSVFIGFTQNIIDLCKDFSQVSARLCMILDQGFADNHEKGCRNSFAGNISHNNRHMPVINHKEIIKISANFLCRCHGRINIHLIPVRKCREYAGKHGSLDLCCHVQLCSDTFLLSSHPGKVIHIVNNTFLHGLGCVIKFFYLISGMNIKIYDVVLIIPFLAIAKFVCCFCKQFNRPGYSLFDFSGYVHTGSQDDQNAKTYHQYSKTNGISDNLCHVNIYKGNCTFFSVR